MDKIICLVGESGSGKTTIAELLEKEGYNYIQSYTTRKPRYEGERGHIFVDSLPFGFDVRWPEYYGFIAYTYFNGNHYWATKEQYQGKGNSIYIIDVDGIKELRELIKNAEITVIYLKADRELRLQRMIQNRDFKSVVDRIKHDKEAFRIVSCDYVVDANRPVQEVLEDIMTLIEMDK